MASSATARTSAGRACDKPSAQASALARQEAIKAEVCLSITASDKGAAREGADSTLITPVMDRSWCHTVAYLSAITAGAVIAGAITGKGIDAKALRVHLDECRALRPQAIEMAQRLRGIERLIVVGGGYDRITADELVLKVQQAIGRPWAKLDGNVVALRR
mgnify:CR=1 FL=1